MMLPQNNRKSKPVQRMTAGAAVLYSREHLVAAIAHLLRQQMDFFSAPAMRDLIHGNLNYLGPGFIDPSDAIVINPDMGMSCRWHTSEPILFHQRPAFNHRNLLNKRCCAVYSPLNVQRNATYSD